MAWRIQHLRKRGSRRMYEVKTRVQHACLGTSGAMQSLEIKEKEQNWEWREGKHSVMNTLWSRVLEARHPCGGVQKAAG